MSDQKKQPEIPGDTEKIKPANEPAPLEPGKYAKLLEESGFKVTIHPCDAGGIEVLDVAPGDLLPVAEFLRDNPDSSFDLLVSVSGVDMGDYRVSVTHLYSLKTKESLTLKTRAESNECVPSLTPLWPAANWHERESYDLMGIIYKGHPNLQRILMPMDWIGHPLRKNYKEEDPRLVWNRR